MSVINEVTSKVTDTIHERDAPRAVAVDPADRTVNVANGESDTVSVIDEATGDVPRHPRGRPDSGLFDLAVDPAARIAYVTDYDTGTGG